MNIISQVRHSLRNIDGATAIEYALIAGGVALVLVPAFGDLSTGVLGLYGIIGGLFAAIL